MRLRDRPEARELVSLVREYYAKPGNAVGGSLHIVLEDCNIDDDHIDFCLSVAREHGDADGERLAELLRVMTKTQRLKVCMGER